MKFNLKVKSNRTHHCEYNWKLEIVRSHLLVPRSLFWPFNNWSISLRIYLLMPCARTFGAAGTRRRGFALNREVREWRRCCMRRKSARSNGSSGINVHDDYNLSLIRINFVKYTTLFVMLLLIYILQTKWNVPGLRQRREEESSWWWRRSLPMRTPVKGKRSLKIRILKSLKVW